MVNQYKYNHLCVDIFRCAIKKRGSVTRYENEIQWIIVAASALERREYTTYIALDSA